MLITKQALPRRTFLRGMGATLADSRVLDAMVPAMSARAPGDAAVRRTVYVGNGMNMWDWTPPTEGYSAFEFSPMSGSNRDGWSYVPHPARDARAS